MSIFLYHYYLNSGKHNIVLHQLIWENTAMWCDKLQFRPMATISCNPTSVGASETWNFFKTWRLDRWRSNCRMWFIGRLVYIVCVLVARLKNVGCLPDPMPPSQSTAPLCTVRARDNVTIFIFSLFIYIRLMVVHFSALLSMMTIRYFIQLQ